MKFGSAQFLVDFFFFFNSTSFCHRIFWKLIILFTDNLRRQKTLLTLLSLWKLLVWWQERGHLWFNCPLPRGLYWQHSIAAFSSSDGEK